MSRATVPLGSAGIVGSHRGMTGRYRVTGESERSNAADALNRRGSNTTKGRRWHAMQVHRESDREVKFANLVEDNAKRT